MPSLVSVCCYLWKESVFMLLSRCCDTVFKLTCMSCHGDWEDSECHQLSTGIWKTRLVPPYSAVNNFATAADARKIVSLYFTINSDTSEASDDFQNSISAIFKSLQKRNKKRLWKFFEKKKMKQLKILRYT